LTRENHQLHIDTIKQKDDLALSLDDQKREIRGLEDRLNEMKYVMVAKDKEMRSIEKEKERMKEVTIIRHHFGYDHALTSTLLHSTLSYMLLHLLYSSFVLLIGAVLCNCVLC
jgi:hypothetical protein